MHFYQVALFIANRRGGLLNVFPKIISEFIDVFPAALSQYTS
jgi:hypothetical protein